MRTKEEAAAWLLTLQAEDVSRAERDAFVDWLRESPLHVAEMLRMENVRDGLQDFKRWSEVDTRGGNEDDVISLVNFESRSELKSRSSLPRIKWRIVGAVAAGSAVVILGGFSTFVAYSGQTIHTERGERREMTLGDGSVVQIDPESTLQVRLTEQSRQVILKRGRALFRVARNPGRPFQVEVDDTIVRAVGTAFGVERRKGGVRVTVAEGKVAIVGTGPLIPQPAVGTDRERKSTGADLLLTANEQITVAPSGSVQAVRTVDSNRELAWAQGRLAFEKETVAAVVEDFNRYNQVQLRVESPALAAQLVSGVFDASDPESFIAFLESMVSVKVIRDRKEGVALSSVE